MALRKIVTLPEPVLRRKARKVTDFGPELQTLIDALNTPTEVVTPNTATDTVTCTAP